MTTLTFIEKQTICRLFGIEEGYIFNYWRSKGYNKNKTRDLLLEACGIDIYADPDYKDLSQQRCVEKIWKESSPQIVANLLDALCNYFDFGMGAYRWDDEDYKDYGSIQEIINRLRTQSDIELPEQDIEDVQLIVRDIEAKVTAGTPELAVDRLHTFATQFFRGICCLHGIAVTDDRGNNYSLDGNVARLKKWYQDNDYFESEFCTVALQNTINILAKFNEIRNERSAAHPNPLLTKAEAEYVVKVVADTLIFVDAIEKAKVIQHSAQSDELPWDTAESGGEEMNLPF